MSTRFACPSLSLGLTALLKRTSRALWVCLGLGVGIHLSFTAVRGLEAEEKVSKPLTTQFVKRQPRLTKPLELKKRPQPRRRQVEREMVAVKARTSRDQAVRGVQPAEALRGLARPRVELVRGLGAAQAAVEPQAVAQAVGGAMQSEDVVDMSLELLDVEAMDTGRYQAMVIQDAEDKRNIRGYLRLAQAYPFSVRNREWLDEEERAMTGVRRLMEKLNAWTGIQASLAKRVTFDSAEFFETPWVFLWVSFSLTPAQVEVENLGKYLLGGGFLYFEGGDWPEMGYEGAIYLRQFVSSALGSQGYRQGVRWEFEDVGLSHPIFTSYYDFASIPVGFTVVSHALYKTGGREDVAPRCRGVEIDGRLVALTDNQLYVTAWCDWGRGTRFGLAGYDPTIPFRFGINTIVFALTQEGSITRRLMESVQ